MTLTNINIFLLDAPITGGVASLAAHTFEALRQSPNYRASLLFLPPRDKATGRRPTILGSPGREVSEGEALKLAHRDPINLIIGAPSDHPTLPDLIRRSSFIIRTASDLNTLIRHRASYEYAPLPALALQPRLQAKAIAAGLRCAFAPLPFTIPASRPPASPGRRLTAVCLSRIREGNGIDSIILANQSVRPDKRCILMGDAGDAYQRLASEHPKWPTFYKGNMPTNTRTAGTTTAAQASMSVIMNSAPDGILYSALESIAAGTVIIAPELSLIAMGLEPGIDAFAAQTPEDIATVLNAPQGNRTRMADHARRILSNHSARAFNRAISEVLTPFVKTSP